MSQPENLDSPTILLHRLHRWRMAFFGLAILIAGLTIGVAATLLTLHYAGPQSPRPSDRFTVPVLDRIVPRLRLSREQAEKVEPVLRKHMQRLEEIREQGRTQITEELEAMDEQMATVLSQDQQRLWRDLMRGLPGQFQRGQGRFGPGRQGPYGPRGGSQGRFRQSPDDAAPSPNDAARPD
ncbi:MAG: hypothetical protein ABFD90_06315 [Phycisphaerales bacterium]